VSSSIPKRRPAPPAPKPKAKKPAPKRVPKPKASVDARGRRYQVSVVHRAGASGWGSLISRIIVDGDRVTLCGGGGQNLLQVSEDGGETFAPERVNVGGGLRMLLVDGETTWVCGEYGLLARRSGRRKLFTRVEVGAQKCMQTLLRADGALWATGDSGAFRSFDDGETWAKVPGLPGEITRPQDSPLGVLLPSDTGRLYICRRHVVTATEVRAAHALWAACATPAGTILAVSDGGEILRSVDGGKTCEEVDSGVDTSLEYVVCTPSGRVFIVGNHGVILCSEDDGQSFFPIKQKHTKRWLFAATVVDERVLVAGIDSLVLQITAKRARPT
jgi:photosystem II stability/assembly factor-like uncharacterized protein